jgi:hypothetical protein
MGSKTKTPERRALHRAVAADAEIPLSYRLAALLGARARAAGRDSSLFVEANEVRALLADPDVAVLEVDRTSGTLTGALRIVDMEARLSALQRGARR